jgi:hypothetical protein
MGLRLDDKRSDISAYGLQIGERPVRHPASMSSGLLLPQAGVEECGVLQVVKTAQSRERTERTLLTVIPALRRRPGGRRNAADRLIRRF